MNNKENFLPESALPAVVDHSDKGISVRLGGGSDLMLETTTKFYVRLVQPNSIGNNDSLSGHEGMFWFSDFNPEILAELDDDDQKAELEKMMFADKLRVIPIAVTMRGRVMYPPFRPNQTRPICGTYDLLTPSEIYRDPISDRCGEWLPDGRYNPLCPNAKWNRANGKGQDEPPLCREVDAVTFFDIDRKMIIGIPFHRTGLGAWRRFQRNMDRQFDTAKMVAKAKKIPLNNCILEITTEKAPSDKGNYYVPKFRVVIPPEELPDYTGLLVWLQQNILPGGSKTDQSVMDEVGNDDEVIDVDTTEDAA